MRVHGLKSPGNDESTARRRVDVRVPPCTVGQPPRTGDGRERLHMGRTRGVVRAWPIVTVTDQGAAIGAPVHVNVFQLVRRKWVNLGAFEESGE